LVDTNIRNALLFLYVLEDLSEHFGKFGEIKNIDLKVDIATGRSRGYAFVMFKLKGGMDNVSIPYYFISLILKF